MGKITLVLGGARSGKSSYALKAAASAKRPAFVATCEALDDEMARRIKKHRSERSANWTTYEEPAALASLLGQVKSRHDLILIDCLTLFVSNLMLKKKTFAKIEDEALAVMRELRSGKGKAIIVSNEVGLGIVPNTRLGRDFRDVAGRVNALAAAKADSVIFMVSGIPWRIK